MRSLLSLTIYARGCALRSKVTRHHSSGIAFKEPYVCMHVCVILMCSTLVERVPSSGVHWWTNNSVRQSFTARWNGARLLFGRLSVCRSVCDILRYQWKQSVLHVLAYHLSEYSWDVWNTRPFCFRGVALLMSLILVCMVWECVRAYVCVSFSENCVILWLRVNFFVFSEE